MWTNYNRTSVGIFELCSSYKSNHKFDTNLQKNSCLLCQNARYEYHPVFIYKIFYYLPSMCSCNYFTI